MSYVWPLDQGIPYLGAMVFRGEIRIAGIAHLKFPKHFPASGWVDAMRRRESGPRPLRPAARREEGRNLMKKDHSPRSHHQPAQSQPGVGPATGKVVAIAMSGQDRRTAEFGAAKERRPREGDMAKNRLIIESVFFGTKVAMDPRSCGRRAGAAEPRRTQSSVPSIVICCGASPAQGARHRRHQRLEHAGLVQNPHRRVGRRLCNRFMRVPRSM